MSSLSLPSVVTEKVENPQGFRQPHTLSEAEETSAWSAYLSSSFQKKLTVECQRGPDTEGTAAAKVISMSLLIHVNSTASLLAKEDTRFSEILSFCPN